MAPPAKQHIHERKPTPSAACRHTLAFCRYALVGYWLVDSASRNGQAECLSVSWTELLDWFGSVGKIRLPSLVVPGGSSILLLFLVGAAISAATTAALVVLGAASIDTIPVASTTTGHYDE